MVFRLSIDRVMQFNSTNSTSKTIDATSKSNTRKHESIFVLFLPFPRCGQWREQRSQLAPPGDRDISSFSSMGRFL